VSNYHCAFPYDDLIPIPTTQIGPEKYVQPVLGEEQVLDVELDRGTTFFDERHAASGFDWETRATTSGTLPLSEETAQPQQLDEIQSKNIYIISIQLS
jgi:hypothetical protein